MPVTIDDLETLRRELTELPANRPRIVSKQNAVAELAAELAAAQRRGYSVEDLAQLLAARGIALTPGTLRGYLRRTLKKRRPAKKGTVSGGPATPSTGGGDGGTVMAAQPQASDRQRHVGPPAQMLPARSDSKSSERGGETAPGRGASQEAVVHRAETRGPAAK